MLLLPLGMAGDFGTALYPSMAEQGHTSPGVLDSSSVLRRYLEGGEIHFDYGESVRFAPLTLPTLVRTLAAAIVKSESGRDQPLEALLVPRGVELEARPRYEISIDETIIEQFCAQDIVLSPHYQEAVANQFTHSNVFFNALDETPVDTRPIVVRVMRDAALVRLLDVAQYVKVHPDFYSSVPKNWSA